MKSSSSDIAEERVVVTSSLGVGSDVNTDPGLALRQPLQAPRPDYFLLS